MSTTVEPVLSVIDLSCYLKIGQKIIPCVHKLCFDLYPATTLAIVGESGSGKSLTALSIMQLILTPPLAYYRGKILFENENLLELSSYKLQKIRGRKIALSFQNPKSCLDPLYRVEEQLIEALLFHQLMSEAEASLSIKNNLIDLGLQDPERVLSAYPHELSGGMCQRVVLAAALALNPKILIADEPTSALDTSTQMELILYLKKIQKDRGMALILITHDLGVVAEMADRILVMYSTRGIESGNVKDIFHHPLHPYTKALFKARPLISGKEFAFEAIPKHAHSVEKLPQGCHFHPRCSKRLSKCVLEAPPVYFKQEQSVSCWLYEDSSS